MYTSILFIFGLLLGSFANAVVWRMHEKKPIGGKERSECPECHHVLAAADLVPVFSWLWLRGKCRYCCQLISWQYPAVELITAVLFALSYVALQPSDLSDSIRFVVWLAAVLVLIIMAVYDLRWMLLPDKLQVILLGLAVAQLAIVLFEPAIAGRELSGEIISSGVQALVSPLMAAVLYGSFFAALYYGSRGAWMGGGDVKLVTIMGLWLGVADTFVALLLAFNTAAIVSLALIGLKIRSRKDLIPFGPFLIGGFIAAYLYGGQLIYAYWRLSGL